MATALLERPAVALDTPRAPASTPAPKRGNSRFSDLEWSVVALARYDRLSSLTPPGPIAKQLARLFGSSRPAALADERLEVLRRTAVLAWHQGYGLPTSRLDDFLKAGFSMDQYELLQSRVGAEKAKSRGRLR